MAPAGIHVHNVMPNQRCDLFGCALGLCVSMAQERLDQLNLPPMVQNNEDPKQTAYTVSVDAKKGTSTGISASDRATTFRMLADPKATADDFYRPGHVFPLRYKEGGVIRRAGHTETAVMLRELADAEGDAAKAALRYEAAARRRAQVQAAGLSAALLEAARSDEAASAEATARQVEVAKAVARAVPALVADADAAVPDANFAIVDAIIAHVVGIVTAAA